MNRIFPEKLGRLQYFIRWLFFVIAVLLILPSPERLDGAIAWLVSFALKLIFLDTPRIRSIGWPSWVILFFIVPFLNLIFQVVIFFVPPKSVMPPTALEPVAAAPSASDTPSIPQKDGESKSVPSSDASALDP